MPMKYAIGKLDRRGFPQRIAWGDPPWSEISCPLCGRTVLMSRLAQKVEVLDGSQWPDILCTYPLIISERTHEAWRIAGLRGFTGVPMQVTPIPEGQHILVKSNRGETGAFPGVSRLPGGAQTYYCIDVRTLATPDPGRTLLRKDWSSPISQLIPLRDLPQGCMRCASTSNSEEVTWPETIVLQDDDNWDGNDFALWRSNLFVTERVIRACLNAKLTNLKWVKAEDVNDVHAPSLTKLPV